MALPGCRGGPFRDFQTWRRSMGLAYARVKLANPRLPDLAPVEVEALADTGAVHLCLPEHIALQLQLEEQEKREATFADGSRRLIPYVGPVKISFANRTCFTGAMVLGNEPLLGAIPMEDMDLVVLPKTRQVAVNPENPNFAVSIAKGLPPSAGNC
jgi:clan AA aspartic protease